MQYNYLLLLLVILSIFEHILSLQHFFIPESSKINELLPKKTPQTV